MEAPKNHLRFDISEKVRLQPQQPGIGSLLALDLYPDVEIQDQGQHLIIQGHLRLYGSYLGDHMEIKDQEFIDEESAEEIAYVIPVEITLPRNRAEMDYISAEVETFDYQVLSPFELQIEAILLIDGILPEPQEMEAEPATFTASEIQIDNPEESENDTPLYQENSNHDENGIEIENQAEAKIDSTSSISEEDEPKEEIKLKPIEDHRELQTELETQVEEEILSEENEEEIENENSWQKWLIREEKEDSFTPLRMVIVQKEDSIQSIAEKYHLPTTQISEYNQLESDQLNEGQILYLPRESIEAKSEEV